MVLNTTYPNTKTLKLSVLHAKRLSIWSCVSARLSNRERNGYLVYAKLLRNWLHILSICGKLIQKLQKSTYIGGLL